MNAEVDAGVAIVQEFCSGLNVSCTASQGTSFGFRFDISNGIREVRIKLSYEFLSDLPGTTEFQAALHCYLSALVIRLHDPDLAEYLTLTGIPLRFLIEFPFQHSRTGGSFYFLHAMTKTASGTTIFEANFSVHLSHTVAINLVSVESVMTEALVVNSVRRFIDSGAVQFYPRGRHPTDLQIVSIGTTSYDYKRKRFVFGEATDTEIAEFLKRKVYWLGFRKGRKNTYVSVADPYDADYLGLSAAYLAQTADLVAADGYIELDASRQFACATDRLLTLSKTFQAEWKRVVAGSEAVPNREHVAEGSTITRKPSAFVSYSSQDAAFAEKVAQDLRSRQLGVWFDKWEIKVGDSLLAKIGQGIRQNDFLIVLLSPSSVKSEWVMRELNAAMHREIAEKRVVVLPALIEDCELPAFLVDKRYADFRHHYENGLHELSDSILSHTQRRSA